MKQTTAIAVVFVVWAVLVVAYAHFRYRSEPAVTPADFECKDGDAACLRLGLLTNEVLRPITPRPLRVTAPVERCEQGERAFHCYDAAGVLVLEIVTQRGSPMEGRTTCYQEGQVVPCQRTLPGGGP